MINQNVIERELTDGTLIKCVTPIQINTPVLLLTPAGELPIPNGQYEVKKYKPGENNSIIVTKDGNIVKTLFPNKLTSISDRLKK